MVSKPCEPHRIEHCLLVSCPASACSLSLSHSLLSLRPLPSHMVSEQQAILAAQCETPPCSLMCIPCYGKQPPCWFPCGRLAMPPTPSCLQERMSFPYLARDFFKPFLVDTTHDPKSADIDAVANSLDRQVTNSAATHPADFHLAVDGGGGALAPVNDVRETQYVIANTATENAAPGEEDDAQTPGAEDIETPIIDVTYSKLHPYLQIMLLLQLL
ncbi:hypothetical protein GOP47_0007824 [Adiantum capillus-veneris]|uniref:Uncharacterized protein n=1 Tax=Adiantum capillus-veneris TaxID=13818 RepID=A0A9D4V1G8_ADICA|nr:hypothetical protein GOP47_0007824 [Adiantum capillus-veneris]